MSVVEDPRLTTVVNKLVEAYQPERIYLFGSHARGEARADSDFDLLVVVPDTASPDRRRSRLAYVCLWDTVLVWARSEFESRLHLPASLPATILREGRILHAA
jgi:predicted nucleotidyltransferase